ncbi:hypothetical protein SERLA73DRAFT_128800, partial [Serpula lacrymans var. lacrymans S7.3]
QHTESHIDFTVDTPAGCSSATTINYDVPIVLDSSINHSVVAVTENSDISGKYRHETFRYIN